MKKIVKVLCIVIGFLSLAIGAIGVVIPILPTFPFVLLSAVLFAKSSDKFHRWLTESEFYRKHVRTVLDEKSMTKTIKIKVLLTLSIIFIVGFIVCPVWQGKAVIIAVAIFHFYYFIFKISTKKEFEKNNG